MTTRLQWSNVALRGAMEAGVVGALAYWGVHAGNGPSAKALLGIAAPVVGFGLWGAVDFRRAGRLAEPLRLTEELVISGLAAVALYAAGQHVLAVALGALSLAQHTLVYVLGDRLLKPLPAPAPAPGASG
jgi:hypothetical protein